MEEFVRAGGFLIESISPEKVFTPEDFNEEQDPASLKTALQSCSHLYHVAADYRLWVPDPQEMYAVNVQGTKDLLTAAAEAGVRRIVNTSTVGALGNPGDGTPGAEDTPVSLKDMCGHYKRSKFLAEQEVLELVRQGLPVVLVHPSAPVGPWDSRPTPTGQMIVDFLKGRMPAYLETCHNLVHVKDVAQGHLLAEARGRIGEKYILGHLNLSLSQILGILAEISGRPAPRIKLPYLPILCLSYVNGRAPGRARRGRAVLPARRPSAWPAARTGRPP